MTIPFDPSKCTELTLSNHGGNCCGISHIWGFSGSIRRQAANSDYQHYVNCAADAEMRIRYLIGKYWADKRMSLDENKDRLYEVVLQSSQRKAWEPILRRIGFECVTDFKNTNSGNRVFVYHYAMGPANSGGVYRSPYEPEKKSIIPNPFKPKPAAGAVVY